MPMGTRMQVPCPPALIGRATEWSKAMRVLGTAFHGNQVALLVTGALRIGKSRFLAEIGTAAARLGFHRAVPGQKIPDGEPIVYLVDDLHVAASELICPLTRSLHAPAGRAILWAVATQQHVHRATEIERYLDLCVDLAAWITLEPLDAPATTRLATELLGAAPDARLDAVLRTAGGNPYLINAVSLGLRAEGLLQYQDDTVTVRHPNTLPMRARLAVDELLRGLTPAARYALSAAARLEPEFHPRHLGVALTSSLAPLLPAAIDELVAVGLLRVVAGRLTFQYPMVRDHLLSSDSTSAAPSAAQALPRSKLWEALTERQRAIADMAAEGLTNRQIARRIGRSTHTVNFHLRKVFRKLGVRSRVELARVRAESLEP